MTAGLLDGQVMLKTQFLLGLFFYNLRKYLYRKKEHYGFK